VSSMAHPTEGAWRALIDGELTVEEAAELRRHAAACATCAVRLSETQQSAQATDRLLDRLGAPTLSLDISTVVQSARQSSRRRAGLIAAGISLLVVSVAGATVGRPVVRALVERVRALVHPAAPEPTSAPFDQSRGVAIVPGSETRIVFDSVQTAGVLRLSLADTAELVIRSDSQVIYRVSDSGIIVHNGGSRASYDLLIPRDARFVQVLVGNAVLFEKFRDQVGTRVRPDTAGRYLFVP